MKRQTDAIMAPLMDLPSIVTSANYRKKINGIKVVSSMQRATLPPVSHSNNQESSRKLSRRLKIYDTLIHRSSS